MRIGFNPQKNKKNKQENYYYHQVIVPVYIPVLDGYYKDCFKILKLCLGSLFKTSHSQTYITIVNNGSCLEVVNYLQDLLLNNKIHELTHSTNIGYVNAMLKGIIGHNFPIVTTSDADVLFQNEWQNESYKLFNIFPKTGAICTTPSSKTLKFYTYNLLLDNIFSKKMKFTDIKNPIALEDFAKSIGNPKFYNKIQLEKNLTVTDKNLSAVIGAGHYVVTYNGFVFNDLKEKYTEFVLGGGSDYILDKPVADKGYWRLATEDNYTYHMGNVIESWMNDKFNMLQDKSQEIIVMPKLRRIKQTKFINFIKKKVIMRILTFKPVWKLFLQCKGLTKEESKMY